MYKKLLTVKPEIVHYTRDQLIKLVRADEASEKGTYKILAGKNALGPMSCCYLEPRARQISRGNEILAPSRLLRGDKAAAVVWLFCIDNSNGGKIKATRDREMTAKDLVKMTGMSKKTVLTALKKLDELGLVRGYRDLEDSRKVHYRINPLYWSNVTKGRNITWIDWIIFYDKLAPFLDEETVKNLNNMAYTQWIRNYSR